MKYMYLEDKESGKRYIKLIENRDSIEEIEEGLRIKCIGSIYTIMKEIEKEDNI